MAKLFVSYSRKDSAAAHRLIEAFRSIDQDVWVDWESIPPAVDWLEQIFHGIEESDAFIFMISPDSIASEVCKVEINRAAQNNKRIIPIVLRDVQAKDAPENIRKLNWTFIREGDSFEEGLAKVRTAIELDLDWLEEHRRLLVRSLEWHRKKDPSLLLRGRDLRNARHMLETATSKDPIPTDLQQTFIQYSLRSERNRTVAWVTGGLALVIMAVLSVIAVNQSNAANQQRLIAETQRNFAEAKSTEAINNAVLADQNARTAQANEQEAKRQESIANDNKRVAEAQRSAARAQIYQSRPGELYTSTLLAIDSLRRNPSDEAEEILRRNISLLPLPVAQVSQQGKINAIAFSPAQDSNTFITASADGTACAWQIANGEANNLFCTPSGQPSINALAFNLDGSLLAIGDQSGLVQILDAKDGTVLHAYRRGQSSSGTIQLVDITNGAEQNEVTIPPVRSLSFQPRNGGHLAVAYGDGEIPVFNPTSGKISSPLWTGETPNVIGFNRTGNWLVAGSQSGRVSVWDLSSSHNFSPATHRGGVLALAFSPRDNSKLATGGNDNSVSMINLSSEKQLFRIPNQDSVRDVAFSPDGSWLVTGSDDHQIRIWDTLTGDERIAMSQDGIVTDVVVSPNGQWLASTGDDRTTRVWDVRTGAEIFQIPLNASGTVLAISNDGNYLVSTDQNGEIDIWNVSSLAARLDSMSFDGIVESVQYSPARDQLAVAEENRVWLLRPDSEAGLLSRLQGSPAFSLPANVKELVFSPDSKFAGVSTDGKQIAVYDIENRTLKQAEASASVRSIAFSPNSEQFITVAPDGSAQVWNTLDSKLVENTDQEYPQAFSIATSAEFIAFGSKDKIEISGIDGDGGLTEIDAPGENTLLAVNESGSALASTDSSGRISIWKIQNSEITTVPPFLKEQAVSLTVNVDGTLLAVGTAKNVFLIDTNSGKEIARIPHRNTVSGLSFSPDGKFLTTASSKVLQLWEITKIDTIKSDQLIPEACSRLFENFSQTQWEAFFGKEPYQPLCEDLGTPK